MLSGADLIDLAFPACSFFGGAFLVLRGMSKLGKPLRVISGKAKCKGPPALSLCGESCVYDRIVLEKVVAGKRVPLASFERRAPFYIGKTLVEPQFADFALKARVTEGLVRREKGMLEEFVETAAMASTNSGRIRLASGSSASQAGGEILPDDLVLALRSIPSIKKPLDRNSGMRIRVSEHSIPQGTELQIGGGERYGDAVVGTLDARLIITDSDQSSAQDSHKERAIIGIAAGAFLLSLSFVLAYLLLSSA
jgi:hypothetical protein